MKQMEFLKFIAPRFFKLKSDQLHTITEQLGNDHDLHILKQEIRQGEYDFNVQEMEIFENKIKYQREINGLKLHARLKRLFSNTPELFNKKIEETFGLANEQEEHSIQEN